MAGKPGVKTTEFWVTIIGGLASVFGQVSGHVPEPWGTIGAAILGAAYSISRALVKGGMPR